ncbi:MAG: response regulator transcription factor [Terriglobales bacterium]
MVGEQRGRVRDREQAIIELVAQGLTNREVAAAVGTTEYVVKNYLRAIYDKLGLWNRVELALWYEARQQERRKPAAAAGPVRQDPATSGTASIKKANY